MFDWLTDLAIPESDFVELVVIAILLVIVVAAVVATLLGWQA